MDRSWRVCVRKGGGAKEEEPMLTVGLWWVFHRRARPGDFLSQVRSIAGPGLQRGRDEVSLKPSTVQAQGPGTCVKAEKCILAEEGGGRRRLRKTPLSGETGGFRVSRDTSGVGRAGGAALGARGSGPAWFHRWGQ